MVVRGDSGRRKPVTTAGGQGTQYTSGGEKSAPGLSAAQRKWVRENVLGVRERKPGRPEIVEAGVSGGRSAALRALLKKYKGGGVTPTVEATAGNMRPYKPPKEAYARQRTRAPINRTPKNAKVDKGPGARPGSIRIIPREVSLPGGKTGVYKKVVQDPYGNRWGRKFEIMEQKRKAVRERGKQAARERKAQYEQEIGETAKRYKKPGYKFPSDMKMARVEVRSRWEERVRRERAAARDVAEKSTKSSKMPKRPSTKPRSSTSDPTAKQAIRRADEQRTKAEIARLAAERKSGVRRTAEARIARAEEENLQRSNARAREMYEAGKQRRAKNPQRPNRRTKAERQRQERIQGIARAQQMRSKAEKALKESGGIGIGKSPRPLTSREEQALIRRRIESRQSRSGKKD